MGKKEKPRKLRVDKKIQKNNKLLYIIGLIIVCIALFFSVNYYLSKNYVYNIPFTNLDVNGNNPIINSNLNNVGNVYYVNNNKLEKIDDNNKIEALKNSITAQCTREYISLSAGYPRIVRNYIIYSYRSTQNSNLTKNSNEDSSNNNTSVVYSLEGNVNNNSFKGEVTTLNSNTGEGQIEYTISQNNQKDNYINVYINNNDITLTPSNIKESNASFNVNLSQGTYKIDYNFGNVENAEKVLNGIYNYVIYGNLNNQ